MNDDSQCDDGGAGDDRSSEWSVSSISRFILPNAAIPLLIDGAPALLVALKTILFNNGFLIWIFNNFLSLAFGVAVFDGDAVAVLVKHFTASTFATDANFV